MGFTQKLGLLAQGVYSDSSLNVGIGGAPSGSYKFETTGTAKISSTLLVSGVVTFGSTLSNGTYSYTLPGATGTLALVGGAGVGTVTSVAAITLGTTGTDLSSTVANGTTTPVITLQVPTASAANRGALSSADWSTFNSKESALTFSSPLVRTVNTISIPVATTSVNGYLSSTDWTTFNNKQSTITLTTTGTSGAATFSANTLNIPNYGSALSGYLPLAGGTLTGALGGTSATFTGANYLFTLNGGGSTRIAGTIANTSGGMDFGLEGAAGSQLFTNVGPYEGGIGTNNAKAFHIATNGTSRLSIASTGAATFSSSIAATTAAFSAGSSGTIATFDSTRTGGGGISISNSGTARLYLGNANWMGVSGEGTGSTAIALASGANSDIIFARNAVSSIAETMRITSGGNVGIGTTSPDLENGGGQVIYNSTVPRLAFRNSTSGTTSLDGTDLALVSSDFYVFNREAGAVIIGTSALERMRITSGGLVGIGTSSVGYTLHVQKSISGNVLSMFYNDANSGADTALITRLGSNCNNTGSYYFTGGIYGVADKIYIYGNGNIVNTNGSYGTLSDITLKENIIDATPKLDDILNLKVRNFNLIGDDTKQIGFIAQEFEQIFPSMIDIDGKSGKKAIKTSVLVPMLVKAIQELKAEIDLLKIV